MSEGFISIQHWMIIPFCIYHTLFIHSPSVQFTSVTQSCLTLCNPLNRSTPGLPVHHQLPEFTQTKVHWVSDATQPSPSLSSPSPCALNLSQHQGLFKWVSSSHQVAKVLGFQLQHQPFQGTPSLLAVQGILKSLLQHHSSKASILRCSAFFIVQLSHPYMTTRSEEHTSELQHLICLFLTSGRLITYYLA